MRYLVSMTKTVTQYVEINVTAESKKDAAQIALEVPDKMLNWKFDDARIEVKTGPIQIIDNVKVMPADRRYKNWKRKSGVAE